MSESTSRAPDRALLEGAHEFPGEYLIKAFGPATEDFRIAIHTAGREAVGARLELSERISSKGNSICITLCLRAETVDEVIFAYERLHAVDGLRLIL
jgi:putative lipoic acid-binding regulatory protein